MSDEEKLYADAEKMGAIKASLPEYARVRPNINVPKERKHKLTKAEKREKVEERLLSSYLKQAKTPEELSSRLDLLYKIQEAKEKQIPLKVKELESKAERKLERLKSKYTLSGRAKAVLKNELKKLYHTGLQKKTKAKRIDRLLFTPTLKYYAGRGQLNKLKRQMIKELQEQELKRKMGLESRPFFNVTPNVPQPEQVQTPKVFFNFEPTGNILGVSQVSSQISRNSQVKNNVQKSLFWRF